MTTPEIDEIYVRLLGLPHEQWRVATGRCLGGDVYEVLGPVPVGERWQFQPGQIVMCEEVGLTLGGFGMLACNEVRDGGVPGDSGTDGSARDDGPPPASGRHG